MIKQLDPPLYLTTPFGPSICHVIWVHMDNIWWGCFQEKTGECWWWRNELVRLATNISDDRFKQSPITLSPDQEAALSTHRKRY